MSDDVIIEKEHQLVANVFMIDVSYDLCNAKSLL